MRDEPTRRATRKRSAARRSVLVGSGLPGGNACLATESNASVGLTNDGSEGVTIAPAALASSALLSLASLV